MKKFYSFILLLAYVHIQAFAATVNITVTDFQFSPANVNVNVGDIVHFTFSPGNFHNATTNGVPSGLPGGATALYSGGPGNSLSFDYTVTVAGTYKYVCEIHGDASSYSGMKGQFTASEPVPVTLSSFFINSTTSKKALLTWTTETEINADHFAVKSSTDGVNFTEIAKVDAVGNSSTKRSYSFTDENITNNKFIYYELVIVDKDGKQKLSEIKFFRNSLATKKLVTQLSPNPISRPGQLMVYFNSEKTNTMKVRVFDATGKQVLVTNMSCDPGLNSGHIHVCDLSAGIYTLTFSMDGLKETKRVVVN